MLEIPACYRGFSLEACDLKVYQDIFMYNFLLSNFKDGAKLLEIGGGESRMVQLLKHRYEIWNLDRLEGMGHGPLSLMNTEGYRLVKDYIGEFNQELPESYFDCVFSISTLEHVPEDEALFSNILADIRRVLKPGGISVHCIDINLGQQDYWPARLLRYFHSHEPSIGRLVEFETLKKDDDLWAMSPYAYYSNWIHLTRQPYAKFGRPVSYNVFWEKPGTETAWKA
jgi:ubiquinone/menaquinone biosynthesis C-methylase UbiE